MQSCDRSTGDLIVLMDQNSGSDYSQLLLIEVNNAIDQTDASKNKCLLLLSCEANQDEWGSLELTVTQTEQVNTSQPVSKLHCSSNNGGRKINYTWVKLTLNHELTP